MTARFAATLFMSALLLFLIEPILAKQLLPLLGGAPAVWNTCMVFFQATLFGGYLFAHGSIRALGEKRQAIVHVVLVAAGIFMLPMSIRAGDWDAGRDPVLGLLWLLVRRAGLPFFVLSASAPSLQRWFARASGDHDAYFLYAASNAGSLVALLVYPLVLEPTSGLQAQSHAWSFGYAALALAFVFCALPLWRRGSTATPSDEADPIGLRRKLRWLLLAAVPSSLLLGVTTHITTDLAPTPLLWILPLALYLATFVLVFARKPPLPHELMGRLLPFGAAAVVFALMTDAVVHGALLTVLHLAAFFLAAMVCHGELARDRPHGGRLTEFYLWMSAGGLVGGLFNGIVAPLLFDRLVEYPLAVVAALAFRRPFQPLRRHDVVVALGVTGGTALLVLVRSEAVQAGLLVAATVAVLWTTREYPLRFAGSVGGMLLASSLFPSTVGVLVLRERNFFGTLRVSIDPAGPFIQIAHGSTLHGRQSTLPERRTEPLAYYARSGPIGDVFQEHAAAPVGVVGLGAGALAAYARPGEAWTFFELNPAVVAIATDTRYFTYLAGSRGRCEVVIGDARLELEKHPAGFGVLVIDAFSSDAVPAHLLTLEAMRLYVSKMSTGGVLAWHISNRHIDLRPVVGALAREVGWSAVVGTDLVVSDEESRQGKLPSQWVAMAADAAAIEKLGEAEHHAWKKLDAGGYRAWTDDASTIVGVLRW